MKEFFAHRLSQLRQSKDVSARDMSLSIGNNENYINRIENKVAYPKMEHFFNICEYLGITPQEFFFDDVAFPIEMNELSADLNKLTKKELLAVHDVVKAIINAKK